MLTRFKRLKDAIYCVDKFEYPDALRQAGSFMRVLSGSYNSMTRKGRLSIIQKYFGSYLKEEKGISTKDAVNDLEPPTFAGANAIGVFALKLPVNAHVTFYSLAVNELRDMISAGVNTFSATDACLDIHNRNTKEMHLHGACGTDTDTGKVAAGGTVDKFVQTLAKGTHCHAIMFFSAGRNTDRTPSTFFPVLFYMHCHDIHLSVDNPAWTGSDFRVTVPTMILFRCY